MDEGLCGRWGVPLMTMMYLASAFHEEHGTEAIQRAARAGVELGADIVKTSYTGDHDSFKALVDSCPVPVVVAGGEKKDTIREVLEMIEDSIACGARGIALGRNIWQSPDPERMVASIVRIVHHGARVSDLGWTG